MPARIPTLGGASNPFGVSNSAFGAFTQGSEEDPVQKALREAGDKRYALGLRYNNGQATEAEYQAAIAAELAIATQMTGSADPDVVRTAQRNVAELTNLQHDVRNHAREVTAAASGDDGQALIAVYESELSEMTPGSTGYVDLQRRIADMRESLANKVESENARQVSYELATVQNAWEAGNATDDQYKAAYAKYAAAQKPGSTEAVNAAANLRDLTYRLDRNGLVAKVDNGSSSLDDLLAFDKAHLSGMNESSQGYRDALTAYENTEKAVYDRDRSKIEDDVQHGKATPAQAIEWYKQAAAKFGDSRDIANDATDRIASLGDAVQNQRDSDAVTAFNNGTMSPGDFIAYAAVRQAAFAPGTSQYNDWAARVTAAKTAAVQPAILASYNLSQQYIQLQKFIADNSAGPAGGTKTTTRQVLGADGKYRTVSTTTATPPTPAELAAWKQRQAEVADAKTQLAELQQRIAGTPNGFVTSQQMKAYWSNELAKVAVGSPEYWSLVDKVNATSDRIHAEALLAGGGVKIGYPGITTSGLGGTGAGVGAAAGGGGGGGGAAAGGGSGGGGSVKVPTTGGKAAGAAKGNVETIASMFLRELGAPDTTGNRQAVMTWMYQEGVGSSVARNNPWNLHSSGGLPGQIGSQYVGPGDKNVAVFATLADGVRANAQNLQRNGYGYPAVVAALRANNPRAFLDAIASSGWAASGYGTRNGGSNNLYSTWSAHFGGSPGTSGGATTPAGAAGAGAGRQPTTDEFLRALGNELSGGDYNSRNSRTGEFGKYQILPGNWSAWAKQYLGDANAAPTPDNQEKVVKLKVNELRAKLGSWQAVAHWWATGGAGDPASQGDPTTWGKDDAQFVTNVVNRAGGQVVGIPGATGATPAPTAPGSKYVVPTTVLTTAAGKGVRSGLEAIVPGTREKDPKSGLTTQQTVGIDFPTNLDGDYFESLYNHLHTAIDQGATSYVYRDGAGREVNILLPDNPMGRAGLVNALDASRVDLAQERAVAAAGTDREAAENARYTAVVAEAGKNQVKLLDTEYGGKYKKGSDMASLQLAGVVSPPIARGLGANPRAGPTSVELSKMTPAGRAEALTERYTGIQTNSLTPIASAQRVTDYAKNYIATETALAQKAWDAGRTTDAVTHLHNIEAATDDHSTIVRQIATYNAQGQAATKAITTATGADVPDAVAQDIARMKAAGGEIADAKKKADELLAEIKPFVKVNAGGDIVYDVGPTGATVRDADNVATLVDQASDGSLKFTKKKLAAAGYGNPDSPNQPLHEEPDRVLTRVPSGTGQGKLTSAYAKWHVGVIGYVKADNGQLLPVKGRVLDIAAPDGQFIVEDPTSVGRWAPGPIYWTAPKGANVRIEPTTDAKGQPTEDGRVAITFDGGDGTTYKLATDETGPNKGALQVYTLSPRDAAGNQVQQARGSANLPNVRDALNGLGFGLSAGDNRPETLAFLLTPNMAGPWVTSYDDARDTVYGGRTKAFGQQLLNQATTALRNIMGGGPSYDLASSTGGRSRGGTWLPLPGPTPPPTANPMPGRGPNLNPLAFLFPPPVSGGGVPASARVLGSPPPAPQTVHGLIPSATRLGPPAPLQSPSPRIFPVMPVKPLPPATGQQLVPVNPVLRPITPVAKKQLVPVNPPVVRPKAPLKSPSKILPVVPVKPATPVARKQLVPVNPVLNRPAAPKPAALPVVRRGPNIQV